MDYEVERKFQLDDANQFAALVEQLGGVFSNPVRQSDTYYAHPSRNFAETDEALRIRSIGESHFVTYKGPRIDQETKTRQELELPLATTDGKFSELLTALGFRKVATVIKSRRSAEFDVEGQKFEVDLDTVEGVGTFAELETVVDKFQLAIAKERMATLANRLGLTSDERRSYLELLLGD